MFAESSKQSVNFFANIYKNQLILPSLSTKHIYCSMFQADHRRAFENHQKLTKQERLNAIKCESTS